MSSQQAYQHIVTPPQSNAGADVRRPKRDPRDSTPRDRSNDTPEQIQQHLRRKEQRKVSKKARKSGQRKERWARNHGVGGDGAATAQ